MTNYHCNKYGERDPEYGRALERMGIGHGWGGNHKVPLQLLAWTKDNPIAGTLAHKLAERYPDTTRLEHRPKFFTQWSLGPQRQFIYALEKIGLIETRKAEHGGTYFAILHHLWPWALIARGLHPDDGKLPCLHRSTLSLLPEISLKIQNLNKSETPPSPSLESP